MFDLKRQTLRVSLAVACACASLPAFAALGSYPLSAADPHVEMTAKAVAHASAQTAAQTSSQGTSALYSVNEVTLDSGTVVREFVATSTNTVFALSWKGPRLPNFRNIFGTYATRYLVPTGTDVQRSAGLGQRGLSASDLVVQSFGRLGRFSGYAYLPSAVPAGVSITDLQ